MIGCRGSNTLRSISQSPQICSRRRSNATATTVTTTTIDLGH